MWWKLYVENNVLIKFQFHALYGGCAAPGVLSDKEILKLLSEFWEYDCCDKNASDDDVKFNINQKDHRKS